MSDRQINRLNRFISGQEPPIQERLKADLAAASAELEAHMASWEYAFAMGAARDGARDHPLHSETRAHTDQLEERYRDLKARLTEHEL